MVIAFLGLGLGEHMLCHCSFPFYRRQLVIWKRPHLRVGGHHDNVPLTSLTAENIIDPWPQLLCFEMYFHNHAKATLSICLSLPKVEKGRDTTCKSISGRRRTTVMGHLDSRTPWKSCWAFFTTAVQSQVLLPHLPFSLFSFALLYLQYSTFWWLSQPLRASPFLL